MYFVDRSKIEETLVYMESLLKEVKAHSYHSFMEKMALERMVHMIIESMLDVGNMMIDGFIMRDPGSFDDIIDILIDEKVLLAEDEAHYKAIIKLRGAVVKDYLSVDHTYLNSTVTDHLTTLEQFAPQVRAYLNQELGVAHAFSNEHGISDSH